MDNVRDVENSDVTVRWLAISRQPIAAAWLKLQIQLGLSPRTIDAYGRGLADFLTFCEWASIDPLRANRAESARYVHDLAPRPGRGGPNVVTVDSGVGLANPTMHLSLVAVRLFYDHLVEEGPRESNPVGRGRYTPDRGFAGHRECGLIPRFTKNTTHADQFNHKAALLRCNQREEAVTRSPPGVCRRPGSWAVYTA